MKPWKSKPSDVFNAAFAADIRALLAEFLSQKDLSFACFKRAWKRLSFGVIHHSCPKLCERHAFTQQLLDLTLQLLHSQSSVILGHFSGLMSPSADAEVNRVLVQVFLVYLLYCLHATRRPLVPVKLSAQQAGLLVMTVRKLRCIRKYSRDACNLFARMVKRRAFQLSTRYLSDCESQPAKQLQSLQECWEELAVYEANAEAWTKAIEGLGFRFGEIEQLQKKAAAAAAAGVAAAKKIVQAGPQASASFLRRGVRGVQEPPAARGARRTRREILEQTAEARAAMLRERELAEATAQEAPATTAEEEEEQPLLLPGMYRVSETAPAPPADVEAPAPRAAARRAVEAAAVARTEDEQLLAMLEDEISGAEALLSESRQTEQATRKQRGRKAQTKKGKATATSEKSKPRQRKRARAPSEDQTAAEEEGASGGEVDDVALLNMLESEIQGAQELLATNDRGERSTRPQSKKAAARKATSTKKASSCTSSRSRKAQASAPSARQPRQADQRAAQTTDVELLASLEQQIAEADAIVAGEARPPATTTTTTTKSSSSSTARARALDAVRNLVRSAPHDHQQRQQRQPEGQQGETSSAQPPARTQRPPRQRSQSRARALQAVQKLLHHTILEHQRGELPSASEERSTQRKKTRTDSQQPPQSPRREQQQQEVSTDEQLLALLEQEIAGADAVVSRSTRRRK